LFVFSVVCLVRAVNPSISNLTATAAETFANITWEYEGPEQVNFYIEYGIAGSKRQFHYPAFN
jgi:receptor-type tyrosine-protein phosphatase zeta